MSTVDLYQRDINRLLRNAVGFDSMLDRMFDVAGPKDSSFPPFNIIREKDEHYRIEMALAGFRESDLEIELKDDVLTISSKSSFDSLNTTSYSDDEPDYIYRGIAKRNFTRKFTMASDMVVDSAVLRDGVLTIGLHRVIPEERRPRIIPIKNANSKAELLQE